MSKSNNPKIEDVRKVFDLNMIRKGVIFFVGLSIVALTTVFLYNNSGEALTVWSQMDIIYILLALFIVFMDLFLGGLRNHIFARKFVPGISQMVSINANLANIFMGAATPSQTGGGPAQWYINYRNGLSLADSMSISVANMISTLIFFPVSGTVAFYILAERIPEGFITHLTALASYAFTMLGTLIIGSLIFPKLLGFLLNKSAKAMSVIRQGWGNKLSKLASTVDQGIYDYRERFLYILKKKPWLIFFSLILTFALYFNKYLLSYVLLLSMGISYDFWTIIAIQAVLQLLLYFAPSPGGTGLAELGIATLMAGIISGDFLSTFTLLNRSFLFFIPAFLGAWVVMHQLKKDASKTV